MLIFFSKSIKLPQLLRAKLAKTHWAPTRLQQPVVDPMQGQISKMREFEWI